MGIQINVLNGVGASIYPEALVIVSAARLRFAPLAADTQIDVGYEVYASRQDRDDKNEPQLSFPLSISVSELNLTQAASTLRTQFETVLRDRCAASVFALGSKPRAIAVRNAIVAVGSGGSVAN